VAGNQVDVRDKVGEVLVSRVNMRDPYVNADGILALENLGKVAVDLVR